MVQTVFEVTAAVGLLGAAFLILLWPLIAGGMVALAFGWWPWGLLVGAGTAAVWFPGLLSGRLTGRTGRSTFNTGKSVGWWIRSIVSSAAFGAAGAGAFALVQLVLGEI
ncbi:MAG: hypothetical protein O3C10_11705 [Chloroflexi bacterium]|nr:hypothetical protein [Chloroflexota bacterium]